MKEHKENPSTLQSDDDFSSYYHNYWKRGQISDHNPIWIEVNIDSSDKFLEEKLSGMMCVILFDGSRLTWTPI